MLFPFSRMRDCQKELVADVDDALVKGRHLIAHAPTGLGKTAATLAPALTHALGSRKKIFFLTSRHTQHHIAIETLRLIQERHQTSFITTDLIGKKWLCSHPGVDIFTTGEFQDYCKTLVTEERCTFYNATRTKSRTLTEPAKAMLNVLQQRPCHSEEAKQHACSTFCTYELLIENAKKSDVIIADYFHIFSPLRNSLLARVGKDLGDIILIVDEAHNLPDRVRSLMSASLNDFTIRSAQKEARQFRLSGLLSSLTGVGNVLSTLGKEKARDGDAFVAKDDFTTALASSVGDISTFIDDLNNAADSVREAKKKSFIGTIAKFITSWNGDDTGYARIMSVQKARSGTPYYKLSYMCLDPTVYCRDVFAATYSSILVSGTLYPMEMYRDVLGLEPKRTTLKAYQSPFPKDNRLNLVVNGVTTRYSQRTEETYARIAEYVRQCVSSIPGNVAVFFPSYAFRDKIYGLLQPIDNKQMLLERQGSSKEERRTLFTTFTAAADRGAVLLGVQAGSFSEGVDLPGKFLNGVVVVGIPLERPNLATKALIDFYDETMRRGWDYGYIYPAMIRSLQAAGRCIRSETDRGVCVFIDERFLWSNYRKVFPSDMAITVTNVPSRAINTFFQEYA